MATWLEELEARGLLGKPVSWLPDGTLIANQAAHGLGITEAEALAFREVFEAHAAEAPFIVGPLPQEFPPPLEIPPPEPGGPDLVTPPPAVIPPPPEGLEAYVSPQAPAPGRAIYLPGGTPAALPPIVIPTSQRVHTCADALRVVLPYARAIIRGQPGYPGQPGQGDEQLARLDAAEAILRAIEAGDGSVHGIGGDAGVWPPKDENGGAAGAPP